MKKSTNKPSLRRKLILRQEIITLLTLDHLNNIVGGGGTGDVCTSIQSKDTKC
jgi:hypothetical protein